MSSEKSWQSRIAESTDAVAAKFVESISYDRRIYKQDIAGSIAHATMLAKVGLITDADRDAIVAGLKSIEADIESGNFVFDESLEDIHMVVEDALIKRIGDPGRKLHTGRSRNDQVATDLLLWLNQAEMYYGAQLLELEKALIALAGRSSEVVMPSFTHLQRAQPISAGAEALAWCTMFERDGQRSASICNTGNWSMPLGSGAIAGTSLQLDPSITAGLLDFAQGPISSIEHTATRDAACDLLFCLAMTAQHLSRWAEQWIIYMTTEFGFIKIADRYTTSSSMMPQKRNPDMLELIRGRCGNVYGDLFALMTILKGLPIGYNRDLQEDKRIVFRAYDTVSSCLTMAAAIVNSASYDKARIEPTLDRGFLDATSLAEYLVTKQIPFRTAHHIVGTLVARCEKEGKHALSQLSVDTFNDELKAHGVAVAVTDDIYTCLGAHNVVKRYQSAGAAGGKPFEDQLASWEKTPRCVTTKKFKPRSHTEAHEGTRRRKCKKAARRSTAVPREPMVPERQTPLFFLLRVPSGDFVVKSSLPTASWFYLPPMSQPRKSHTLEIIEKRLRDAVSAATPDPMELIGLHDELSRVERKWIEQTRAGSDRRRPNDRQKMDAYFDRLARQIDASLRRTTLDPAERTLLDKAKRAITDRPADWGH